MTYDEYDIVAKDLINKLVAHVFKEINENIPSKYHSSTFLFMGSYLSTIICNEISKRSNVSFENILAKYTDLIRVGITEAKRTN